MALITDDYNAVESTQVAVVCRPDAALWLTLTMVSGHGLMLYFASIDARDTFWKLLVDAMSKA